MTPEERTKRIHEWFKDHRIFNYKGIKNLEIMVWAKQPPSNIFRVDYLRKDNRLFVAGDLGAAVYQWSENVILGWIADCGLSYFAEKCIASESGRGYKEFDADAVHRALEFHFQDEEDEFGQTMKKKWEVSDGPSTLSQGEAEWKEWLSHYGHEVFGNEWWEMGLDGMVVSMRCEAHLIGLKMAMESLREVKMDETSSGD